MEMVPYGYLDGHSHSHWQGGSDPLSFDDILPFGRSVGDILVATTVNGRVVFRPYSIVVPGGAALRNAFVLDNGDTSPTYKPTLDATNPVIVTPGGAGGPGTSTIYAHRDHDHPATDVASATTLTNVSDLLNATIALSYANEVSANQQLTSNSTVFQNVTNMIVPLTANQVWKFFMTVIYISSVAADIKFQFTVPAGATLYFLTGQGPAGGVATVYPSWPAATPFTFDGIAANLAFEISGTVICGGTAGNLQLQAAQNTATVETTDFVLAGSNVFARRTN